MERRELDTLFYGRFGTIWTSLAAEVLKAEDAHGKLPFHDPVRCAGILVEEAGEVMKEALGATRTYGMPDGSIEALRKEAVQAATVAMRIIEGIDIGEIRGVADV